MKVLNFGSLNFDYVYRVPHIVRPGETLASLQMSIFPGGKGLNQSMALSRAGVPVFQAGSIGRDGGMFLSLCAENNINTDYIQTVEEKSGHAIIQLDERSQNCILIYGGANRCQRQEHIEQVLQDFEAGDILLLQNEVNELDYLIEQAFRRGMTIVLNPSPLDNALDACDLSKVSIFILNEAEGELLAKKTADCNIGQEVDEILKYLRIRFPASDLVLTLGEKGSVFQGQNGCRHKQAAIPVNAVDTTAAGDTFTGYYIAGLLKKMEIPDILKMCACASAIAVSRPGAAPSIPKMEEVKAFLSKLN